MRTGRGRPHRARAHLLPELRQEAEREVAFTAGSQLLAGQPRPESALARCRHPLLDVLHHLLGGRPPEARQERRSHQVRVLDGPGRLAVVQPHAPDAFDNAKVNVSSPSSCASSSTVTSIVLLVSPATILDAIALLLSPTNFATLSDTDYYGRNVQDGFVIDAVMALPSDSGIDFQLSWVSAFVTNKHGLNAARQVEVPERRQGCFWHLGPSSGTHLLRCCRGEVGGRALACVGCQSRWEASGDPARRGKTAGLAGHAGTGAGELGSLVRTGPVAAG